MGEKTHFKKDFFSSSSIIITGAVIIKENGEILMDASDFILAKTQNRHRKNLFSTVCGVSLL